MISLFVAASILIAPIPESNPPSNNFEETVDELHYEIHKGPTDPEFLIFLQGNITAAAPFAAALGEEVQNHYLQFANDFAAYKQEPRLSLIKTIEHDVEVLSAQIHAHHSPLPFKQPMDQSLERLGEKILQTPIPLSTEIQNELEGEEYILWLLASELGSRFDDAFDELDDDFEYFIENPTEEYRGILLDDITILRSLLKE